MSNWWDLPGPARYIKNIADDLDAGKSAVLWFSALADGEAVRDRLRRRLDHIAWDGIALADFDGVDPVRALAHHCRVEISSIAELTRSAALGGTAIWLRDARALSAGSRAKWFLFLAEYAHAARLISPRDRTVFVVPVHGVDPVADTLQADVLLAIHWCWGVSSRLDMALHVAQREAARGRHDPLHEAILTRLGGFDPAFADHLGEADALDVPGLVARALDYRAAWLAQAGPLPIPATSRMLAETNPALPGPACRDAWSRGLVDLVRGGVVERHVASHADAHFGLAIERHVWRAQASELLPWLDELRAAVVGYLRERFGRRWFKRDGQNGELVEYGDLKYLLDIDRDTGARVPAVREFVRLAHRMRNALAHLEHVNAADITSIRAHAAEVAALLED